MSGRNTSVALSDHFARFIEEQVETGRYASASEVVREGLRLLEERERKINVLEAAIEEGRSAPLLTEFDPEEFLSSLHRKHAA